MKLSGDFEFPFKGPASAEIPVEMLAPTKRQRIEFINVELKLGLLWVRLSTAERVVGNETQAREDLDRAIRAYDRARKAFTGNCEIGKWQRRHLRGEIEKLAGLLRPRRAYQAGIYDQRNCDPEHGI